MSVSRRGGRLCTNILYVYIDSGDGMADPCRDISHCTNLTLFSPFLPPLLFSYSYPSLKKK